jgi:hypothetical protein
VQYSFKHEFAQRVIAGKGARGRVRCVDDLPDRLSVDTPRTSGQVKLVVPLRVRKGVEREAAITPSTTSGTAQPRRHSMGIAIGSPLLAFFEP